MVYGKTNIVRRLDVHDQAPDREGILGMHTRVRHVGVSRRQIDQSALDTHSNIFNSIRCVIPLFVHISSLVY